MTHDIKCPHCGTAFTVDQASYAEIVQQVRTTEFEQEIHKRLELAQEANKSAIKLAKQEVEQRLNKEIATQQAKISTLEEQLKSSNISQQLAVKDALQQVEKERDSLQASLDKIKLQYESQAELNREKQASALQKIEAEKQTELEKLNSQIIQLKHDKDRSEANIKENYENRIQLLHDEIERIKDFNARLSTKMVGESLERHCQDEFNKIRATAFPNAYFEKDNDASQGSKGDFIFRDKSADGVEIVSIMFEMKNERDETATKHKNEDFFKELDKDRNAKGCEYAVLVSMLERDSELYNSGIVDVSHRYEKMYVVRPQFFIPIITLLRNAALNAVQYKTELAKVREQNIDITNFEAELEDFKNKFGRNYELASRQFMQAIEEIDKSITHMQKIKDQLLKSENNLRLANDKAQDVSVKRLTRNNPTMAEKFKNLADE